MSRFHVYVVFAQLSAKHILSD